MLCPNCSALNAPTAKFCSVCGGGMFGATGNLPPHYQLVGRYLIRHKIADGGFSAVYQAEDTRLGRQLVAVKEMAVGAHRTNPQAVRQAVADFQQEAELLARITHRNLARVIDRFEDGGRHFLVMDFVQGQTLRQVLEVASGPLPAAQVLGWATQLCEVLTFLHSQPTPLIYRDLKPENVLLQADGTLKLIDFGIARFYKPGQTTDTTPLGTLGYAAPEQFGHGQSDVRTDVFALGAMLFELLTGYDPAQSPFDLPLARTVNPRLSAQVEAALHQATQPRPTDRFASVVAFQRALMGAVPTTPTTIAGTQHKRRHRSMIWGLALVVILGGVGLGVYATASSKTVSPAPPAVVAGEPTTQPVMQPALPTVDPNSLIATLPATEVPIVVIATAPSAPTNTPEPTAPPTLVPTIIPEPTTLPTPVPTNTPPSPPTATVEPTPIPTATAIPEPTMSLAVSVSPPVIRSRAEWGAASPSTGYTPQTPQVILLHHDGVFFDDTDPAAQPRKIRGIQTYLMRDLGFIDFPWHYVIDLNGGIWEARPPTVESQTRLGYTPAGVLSIGLLGDYDQQQLSDRQQAAIVDLMAWLCQTYGIEPTQIYPHGAWARRYGTSPDVVSSPGRNVEPYFDDEFFQNEVARRLAER